MAELPADRCPYPRPFPPEFDDCPVFQPAWFVAASTREQPLGEHLSCVHLRAGESSHNMFYAQCGLGDPASRVRWLDQVGTARLEKLRRLQLEFEQISSRYRPLLVSAKARVLAHLDERAAQLTFDQLLDEFTTACSGFLTANNTRFVEVGLPVGPLSDLINQILEDWRSSRALDPPQLTDEQLRRFTPESRVLLGRSLAGNDAHSS
ncbi:MAG: hypothetical protein ABR498_07805 [Candidatus Dormibacteria bacterium]